jgi:hypothetical protein
MKILLYIICYIFSFIINFGIEYSFRKNNIAFGKSTFYNFYKALFYSLIVSFVPFIGTLVLIMIAYPSKDGLCYPSYNKVKKIIKDTPGYIRNLNILKISIDK